MELDICANCGDTVESVNGRWWSATALDNCEVCPATGKDHAASVLVG